MKNKSTIILGIIFGIFVALYLVTSLNPPEVTRGAVPLFDGVSPDIDKIELNHSQRGYIVLEKRNGTWFISQPFDYKAYDVQVESMISDLLDTMVDGIVSSRVDARDQFSVGDSTGTLFTAYSAGEPVIEAIIGRHSTNIGHTYARKADSNDIELWRGMISQEIIREPDEWRDRSLYNFNTEDIIAIKAVEGSSTRMLAIPDSVWVYIENGTEKPVAQNKVRSLAALISGLTCDSFAEEQDIPRAASKDPEIRVSFTVRNGDTHSFDLWKPDEGGAQRYLVRKVDGDILFLFQSYRGSQLVIDYEMLIPDQT